MRCPGSSHCKFYAETLSQWEKYMEEMKTEEDKACDRVEEYKIQKRKYVHSLAKSGDYLKKYRLMPSMINCPFCLEKIKGKKCGYCLAEFKVVSIITDEELELAKEKGYFLIKSV